VAVAVFMSTLDSSIVNVALPAIMKSFRTSLAIVEWVIVIYLVTVSSLLLVFGRLSDIKGRRYVYCTGFIIFTLGSLFCGLSTKISWLIFARAFQGVGAAMLMACSPAIVFDIFPAEERGRALGLVGTVVAMGLTAGPVLGGLIVKYFSWRAIFYLNIPIGILALVSAAKILQKEERKTLRNERFDWFGAALVGIGLCSFIMAIVKGGTWRKDAFVLTLLIVLFFVSITLLIAVEKKIPDPIVNLDILKTRNFSLPVLSAVILFAGLFHIVFLMPFYLVYPQGYSFDQVGYTMMIPFVCLFFISPISGALSDKIGSKWLCTIGMAILALCLYFLSQLTPKASFLSIAWRLALGGIGTAIFLPPNSNTAISALPMKYRGIASGTIATARNLGMVIGVALAGLVFHAVFLKLSGGIDLSDYNPQQEDYFGIAFSAAMISGAVFTSTGVVISYMRGSDNAS
jgi:EmrB/QacA subfamily drug resistance transporter